MYRIVLNRLSSCISDLTIDLLLSPLFLFYCCCYCVLHFLHEIDLLTQRTASLERSLEQNSGWHKFFKRGVHTLRKPQYQVLI